ncbi:MAG: class I SAM-dependent methyltransferase, partial [Candidatus Binatia bacterium]
MRSRITNIRSGGRRLYKSAYTTIKNRREISRLNGDGDKAIRSVARAISAALSESSSIEERLVIERIESLRSGLEASTTEIAIMDYGAGSPDLNLTPEEMFRGRVVARTIGDVCRRASIPRRWAFLLFKLIRELRPSVCLELGTALGISAAYQAAALELNGIGIVVSLEGAESLASLARMNLEQLALERGIVSVGRFNDILHEVLTEHPHVDFAFIDG